MSIKLIVLFVFVYSNTVQSVILKVQQGLLQGKELISVADAELYYSFKGIPYAKPPLGKLRFKAPQPPVPWKGIRKATEHGPVCIQFDIFQNKVIPGSEDCLFLNVYTRNLHSKILFPVMFFIHGGGFKSQSGNDDLFGPDFLLLFNVVVVTINYRLEVLGNLQLDTPDVPGNAGMKDQVAALKWVKENIRKFGGDPDNVTIFGQSAGGASVGYHMLSPMSKGLFQRAIAMSGVPLCDFATPFEIKRKSFKLGAQLGLDTCDPNELLDFLQSVPAEKLINVNTSAIIAEDIFKLNRLNFIPAVEIYFGGEHFLTEDPLSALTNQHVNEVDFMTGYTNAENLQLLYEQEKEMLNLYNNHIDALVPLQLQYKITPEKTLQLADNIKYHYFKNKPINKKSIKQLLHYFTDETQAYGIHRFLRHLPKMGESKRYFYIFSCQSGRNTYGNKGSAKYGVKGAAHQDDLNYLFNPKRFNLPVDQNSKEYQLILQICLLFTNFAKYGDPTPVFLDSFWQEYDSNNMSYLEIGQTLKPGIVDKVPLYFWENIFKEAGMEF